MARHSINFGSASGAILALMLAPILALPATALHAQDIADAANLTASAPDMLMRGAVANCLTHSDDLTEAMAAFQSAGWDMGEPDDGGLSTVSLDEVTVTISPDANICRVESTALGFADAKAISRDLMVLAHGGAAVETAGDDGCPWVASDAEPDFPLIISTGGQDPSCQEAADAGVMITVLDGQD